MMGSETSSDAFLFQISSSFSSSSSSSILEPPSYADAIFRPAEPEIAGNSTSDYLEITVADPQKESDSYVTYLITTRVRGASSPCMVRRRFRDVVALAERLAESYRGFFIPIRPDKGVVESQVMQRNEFLEQRRDALEKYLMRLVNHPVVGCGEEIRGFLREEGKLPLSPTVDVGSRVMESVQPAKGGRDLMRMFRELKQSVANDWGGVKPLVEEEDKEFLERKGKVQEFGLQLSATSEQVFGF